VPSEALRRLSASPRLLASLLAHLAQPPVVIGEHASLASADARWRARSLLLILLGLRLPLGRVPYGVVEVRRRARAHASQRQPDPVRVPAIVLEEDTLEVVKLAHRSLPPDEGGN